MNLKEAFRFQNKLQSLIQDAQYILCDDRNTTKTETTVFLKKVMADADNETTPICGDQDLVHRYFQQSQH